MYWKVCLWVWKKLLMNRLKVMVVVMNKVLFSSWFIGLLLCGQFCIQVVKLVYQNRLNRLIRLKFNVMLVSVGRLKCRCWFSVRWWLLSRILMFINSVWCMISLVMLGMMVLLQFFCVLYSGCCIRVIGGVCGVFMKVVWLIMVLCLNVFSVLVMLFSIQLVWFRQVLLLSNISLVGWLCRMLCFRLVGIMMIFLVWLVFNCWCVLLMFVGCLIMCVMCSVLSLCSSLWLVVLWFLFIISIGRLLVIWCWQVVGQKNEYRIIVLIIIMIVQWLYSIVIRVCCRLCQSMFMCQFLWIVWWQVCV